MNDNNTKEPGNGNASGRATFNNFESAQSSTSTFQSRRFREAVDCASIPALWEHFDLPGSPARSCHSPFRDEQNPSFSVYPNGDGLWRFKDHGEPDVCGDAYEFFLRAAAKEKSAASAQEFIQLVASLPTGDGSYSAGREVRQATTHHPGVAPPDFSSLVAEFSATLQGDPAIQERLAEELGVRPCTIGMLAAEGSLGFSPEREAMTTHTPHGVQARRSDGTKQNLPGSQIDLWRGDAAHASERVILTEGASDAIAAIDGGLETSGDIAVVALPSAATSFHEPGIEALRDKDVILIPDRDEAGGRLARNARERLLPRVRSLRCFSWALVLERYPDLTGSSVKDLRDLNGHVGGDSVAERIYACSPLVEREPDDTPSGEPGPDRGQESDIEPEPLSSSFPDVLNKTVAVDDELIQHGFLRRGQTMLFVAPSGAGKSSLNFQLGTGFALGRECLGFRPVRPLTVLLIQSENDDTDQREVAEGVSRGLGLDEGHLEILRERFFFRECQESGDGFLDGTLQKLIRERNPDLVIIDPYGDFQADTANNEQQVKAFLVKLREIIKRAGCGCVLVHHTPKPGKEKSASGSYDEQYRAYGSSLLSNHVRANILLKPMSTRGFFEMKVVKRGERLRWVDDIGNPTSSKFIRHADPGQGIFWQLATPEEVAAERGIELAADGHRKKGEEDVLLFLSEHDGPVEKGLVKEHLNTDPGKLGVNRAASLLKKMIAEEAVFEHQLPRAGRKAALALALTPPDESDPTTEENAHGGGDHGMGASP